MRGDSPAPFTQLTLEIGSSKFAPDDLRFSFLATLTSNGFSKFQPESRCSLDYEESRFASARGDVDNRRTGQTNHRTADVASKEERVRIDEHRLEFPVPIAEDREFLCAQIDRFLHDVIS